MAVHETKERNGHPVTTLQLDAGEKVTLCRCFQSQNFPFCDGTHRQHPGKGPAIIQRVEFPESSAD